MDISIGAATSAPYMPQQAYSQQGGANVSANATGPSASSTGQAGATVNVANPGPDQTSASPDRKLQEARKQNPAAAATAQPGYTFEVDPQNHRIMKVNDAKGVLIYQVPSKGQLALVEAQGSTQKNITLTA